MNSLFVLTLLIIFFVTCFFQVDAILYGYSPDGYANQPSDGDYRNNRKDRYENPEEYYRLFQGDEEEGDSMEYVKDQWQPSRPSAPAYPYPGRNSWG
uniref:Uncharacterized protein n=1 Tax=Panagrolaimus superbus TaxID=310955 RepID=A0A914XXV4_9BILA